MADRTTAHETSHAGGAPPADPGAARAHQRERFGGFNIGAAFFGWLVALGMAAILTAILSAAGAAVGLTEGDEARGAFPGSAETVSVVGAILLLLALALSWFAGGYVAGRMSRFDGGRQGLGAWLIGLLLTILLAVAGAVAGSEYNVLRRFELPRIPVEEGDLATGGIITLLAVIVVSLLAAFLGGKAGERYHRKVDRAGIA